MIIFNILLLAICVLSTAIIGALATTVALRHLRSRGVEQVVRDDGPETHLDKSTTPTMGGIAIIPTIALLGLLFAYNAGLLGPRMYLVVAATVAYAVVGLIDDTTKARAGKPTGWRARYKIATELLLAVLFVAALIRISNETDWQWHTGLLWLWVPLAVFVLVGGANSVNLTDGLDGLAAGLSCICGIAMAIILLLYGDHEMALGAAIVAGAAAGFLWFNIYPARIFMGDIGSLGLGAALSAIAIAAKIELLFVLIAAVFVWETLSVIIQVVYFKRTGGKRVFKMAPFHHHLELCGWGEPTIVVRLWLVGAFCALIAIVIARVASL